MLRQLEKLILFTLFVLLVYRLGKATITLSQKENGWSFDIDFKTHPLVQK